MKILLTGINGFIGSNIYNDLKNKYEFIGLSKSEKSNICDNYISCDLTDKENVEKVFKENPDIEIIIHSAAIAHNKGNDLSKENFMKVNYEATKYLVDFSNKYLNLDKFIFLSTISVYGERIDKSIYLEDDECFPKSPYAIAKKKSEEYIQEKCKSKYFILRLAPVYGKDFMLNIKRRTQIKNLNYMVGNGNNKLSLCNVKNISSVVFCIIKNSIKENEVYNLSDEKIYTFYDILKLNQVSSLKIYIPIICIKILYFINKYTFKSLFIEENSIKLICDNIYSSKKLNNFINLKYNLKSY